MAQRKDRAYGPYLERGGYRVVFITGGTRTTRLYQTDREANEKIALFYRALAEEKRTVSWALTRYERYLRDDLGNTQAHCDTTRRRLQAFFDPNAPLGSLTPKRAAATYERYRRAPTRTGRPPSADTARNTLGQAKTFLGWCAEQGWLKANPLASVKGKGKRRRGKAQLTGDEAQRVVAHCLETPCKPGRIGTLLALVLGLRASEVVGTVARDLDRGGTVLWVRGTKTEAAARTVAVPAFLRGPLTSFFRAGGWPEGYDRHNLGYDVRRICRLVGVPVVSPHGLRGTHASLARLGGATGEAVAAALGHTSTTVTERHYTDRTAAQEADQRQVLRVLEGGRR